MSRYQDDEIEREEMNFLPQSSSSSPNPPSCNNYSSSPDRISDHNIDAISPSTCRVAALRIQIGTNLKAVGRTRSETRVSQLSPISAKQGRPATRKVRRWNNDNFVGIANELSNESSNPRIAELFREAHAEREMYAIPNCPIKYRSSFARLISETGNGIEEARHDFIKGKVSTHYVAGERKNTATIQRDDYGIFSDGKIMYEKRIQERLKRLIIRLCMSSDFIVKVLNAFEAVLVSEMSVDVRSSDWSSFENILNGVLLQPPLVSRSRPINQYTDCGKIVRFNFDIDSSRSARHRMLLHALCQFHGLKASSTTTSRGRTLTVTGLCKGGNFRLIELINSQETVVNEEMNKSHCGRSSDHNTNPTEPFEDLIKFRSVTESMSTLEVN